MAKLHEVHKALTAAGLPVGGISGLHEVAQPASFIVCGAEIWRLDWNGAPTEAQEAESLDVISLASGGDLAELLTTRRPKVEAVAALTHELERARASHAASEASAAALVDENVSLATKVSELEAKLAAAAAAPEAAPSTGSATTAESSSATAPAAGPKPKRRSSRAKPAA